MCASPVYTLCFSGTGCTRDEGEISRVGSDTRIYSPQTGYIPVRLHREISGSLFSSTASVVVRGVGENDWGQWRSFSERLLLDGPLNAPADLLSEARKYADGQSQVSMDAQATGWSAPALALHAANLAAASGAQRCHFVGHSRGAVVAIMAAWFLYAYGRPDISVSLFAIDPVPGPGNWYGILTQLPPNVARYVGVYAWDHLDTGFMALTPRPNGGMTGQLDAPKLGNSWSTLADACQLADPLAPSQAAQPKNYHLYVCRGRHGSVAGNITRDGRYNPTEVSASVEPVAQLVYLLARAYLTEWGTVFQADWASTPSVSELRRRIHTDHAAFDAMGGGPSRSGMLEKLPLGGGYLRTSVRQVSSISGRNPFNRYYLEDVVGDPPYPLSYPVTFLRQGAGWVNWKFL